MTSNSKRYSVWASNKLDGRMTVATQLTSKSAAVQAARQQLGSGWTAHIVEVTAEGYEVEVETIKIR